MCFSEEETYPAPAEVKPVQAKIGEKAKRGVITCFTFATPAYVTKQTDQGRRHTISGHEIHDKSYRANLRDDLLRSLAQKEMRSRSVQITEEEKKGPPEESFNRQKSRRRSSLVTDVITATTSLSQHKSERRRSSLAPGVIKFDSKDTNSGGSLVRYRASLNTSIPNKLEIVKARTTDNPVPCGRETRMKEIAQLKYTSAARAAKMAFQEAHISMKANRRLSIQCPAHYTIIPGVEKLPDFYSMRLKNVDKNTSAKFKSWQKKFKIGLTANSEM